MINNEIKELLGFKASDPNEVVLSAWKVAASRYCKPCWELKYCPYGPLVEQSPLLPPLRNISIQHNEYLKECLRTGILGDGKDLDDTRRQYFQKEVDEFNPTDYPDRSFARIHNHDYETSSLLSCARRRMCKILKEKIGLEVDSKNEKIYALLGFVAPFVAYLSMGVSIMFSPWFSWQRNALSDLGHSVKSGVAPIFNLGLILTGFLIMMYTVTVFKKHAKYTSVCLIASAIILQLVATFDEVYGSLHGVVAVLFFISIWVTSVVNAVEKRSLLALMAFIVGIGSWILYGMKIYSAGIAVPEIISFAAVASLLQLSAIKIYLRKN